jgi:GT2 family glycosyltransferase
MKYSILIVNYKTKEDVLILLKDIEKTFSHLAYEVIIVDNQSGDIFPQGLTNTNIIYNSSNSGFGKGMNLAASKASGEFLVLINPDCRIQEDQSFDLFVENAYKEGFGVLSCLIRYPDGRIQPNRGGSSNTLTYIIQALRLGRVKKFIPSWVGRLPFIRTSIIGKYLHNFEKKVSKFEYCDWLSGSFMVIPSDLFKRVHGFDENIFMYTEDEDLCIRIREIGEKCLFSSEFTLIHEVGGAQKTEEKQRLKFSEIKRLESNIYFIEKHKSRFSACFLRLFYFFLYLLISPKVSRRFFKSFD